jgi:hypothetical protein
MMSDEEGNDGKLRGRGGRHLCDWRKTSDHSKSESSICIITAQPPPPPTAPTRHRVLHGFYPQLCSNTIQKTAPLSKSYNPFVFQGKKLRHGEFFFVSCISGLKLWEFRTSGWYKKIYRKNFKEKMK